MKAAFLVMNTTEKVTLNWLGLISYYRTLPPVLFLAVYSKMALCPAQGEINQSALRDFECRMLAVAPWEQKGLLIHILA